MDGFSFEALGLILTVVAMAAGLAGWSLSELRATKAMKMAEQDRMIAAQLREEASLRRNDVLAWGLGAIRAMQTLVLFCSSDGIEIAEDEKAVRLADSAIELSILIEQGRLFFRNKQEVDWGRDKEPAYQGIRPKVLDQLVIGFQVAQKWPSLGADRPFATEILVCAAREFLSHMREEVGREKVAQEYNETAGVGVQLERMIQRAKQTGSTGNPSMLRA